MKNEALAPPEYEMATVIRDPNAKKHKNLHRPDTTKLMSTSLEYVTKKWLTQQYVSPHLYIEIKSLQVLDFTESRKRHDKLLKHMTGTASSVAASKLYVVPDVAILYMQIHMRPYICKQL